MVYQTRPKVFEDLRLAIMQGVFKPRERLLERTLAAQYGVSRTRVREAVRKLESIGMVRIIPYQGARVVDFSVTEIKALYLVRTHLEQLAAKLASISISPGEIRELAEINRDLGRAISSGDAQSIIEFDQKFHLMLCRSSQNPFLMREIENLRFISSAISYVFWGRKRQLRTSLAEHKRIIASLRKKDQKELHRLIEKQLNNAQMSYLEFLGQS